MIVLRTPKGWTCPKEIDGRRTEDYWRSHQVPMGAMHENRPTCASSREWMKSYQPEELFDDTGGLRSELADLAPHGTRRMSANPHTNGGCSCAICGSRTSVTTPSRCPRPDPSRPSPRVMGAFLRDVMKLNMEARNFRLFSPDENNSNRWQDALEVTNRAWVGETYPWDDHLAPTGG